MLSYNIIINILFYGFYEEFDINSIYMNGGGNNNNIINELLNKYITKYNYYKSLLI
jgi:hypothetical protein